MQATPKHSNDPVQPSPEQLRELWERVEDDAADSYGERLIERYVSHHENRDAAESLAVGEESPARTLRDAARYLERHGWIQGEYYDATSGVFTPAACMVGAVGMVCYGGPVDAPAQMFDAPGFVEFEAALQYLDGYLIDEYGLVSYEFNDTKGRTAVQVTDALRDAAADWQPQPKPRHVDDLHTPGTKHDCQRCETECFCTPGLICVCCELRGVGESCPFGGAA